jgi:hypothetical protein
MTSFHYRYTQALLYAHLLYAFLSNAACQFTPLQNLHSFLFGLTLVSWLHSIKVTPYL